MSTLSRELFPQQCGCHDCEAAVSPAAYLTALLDHALKNIRNHHAKIDLPFLEEIFHQPFGDLPTDCEALDKQVRQARICAEALRSYLGKRPLPDAYLENELQKEEAAYRFGAYSSLLTKMGTSYEEIRRMRNEKPAVRKQLAERLGISLTEPRTADPNGDELDQLFFDPANSNALTEQTLEKIFGLADTTRNPLSDGAKYGDDAGQIVRWNLAGMDWSENTDEQGLVYMAILKIAADAFQVVVYKDRDRTKPVASGEGKTAKGAIKLVSENNSRLNGVIEINYTTDSNDISISAIPAIVCWQLQQLHTLWYQLDHPVDAYSRAAAESLPVIDPDIIGPDDFRMPFQKTNAADPDLAFDLWIKRRVWVDTTLKNIKTKQEADGLTAILLQTLGDPLPNLNELLDTLTKGESDEAVKTATEKIEARHLSVKSFTRLMAIRFKDQLAQNDVRNEKLQPAEWEEVHSILTQAIKTKEYPNWLVEEQAAGIEPGPAAFWLSLSEPKEGSWPVAAVPQQPWIDPDMVKTADLPEWRINATALSLFTARKKRLKQIVEDLKIKRESGSNGFDIMIRWALGHPNAGDPPQHNVNTLLANLSHPDPTVQDTTIKQIENDCHLSVDGFRRLMLIKAKDDQPLAANKPTLSEWAEVYALLSRPRKIKHEYSLWVQEEKMAGLDYWKAIKARLPLWRASAEDRQQWQQALRNRMQQPVIDPLVIGAENIQHLVTGDPAFDTWKSRYNEVTTARENLKQAREAQASELDGIDLIIGTAIGIPPDLLQAINQENLSGKSIEKKLAQLNLDIAAFLYVLRIRDLVRAAQPVTDAEWEILYATLTQVSIRKQFARWQQEEQLAKIILSPRYFKIPSVQLAATSSSGYSSLAPWLSAISLQFNWQDVLQSRMNQVNTIIESHRAVVMAVEEAILPLLRNALIKVTRAPGNTLDEQAEWVTRQLLIDAKAGGCNITTRIAQAIETLQGFLFGLRTGQFHQRPAPLIASLKAISQGEQRIDLFACSKDHTLWHRIWDGEWKRWYMVSPLPGTPLLAGMYVGLSAVSRQAGTMDVFVVASDNALWQITCIDGKWSTWTNLGGELATGSRPAAISRAPGMIDVFALHKGDLVVQQKSFANGIWSAWQTIGTASSRSPAAASWGDDRLDVFVALPSPSLFKPVHRWWDGTWHDELLDDLLASDADAVAAAENRLDLVQNKGGRLWQKSWNGAWQPWFNADASLPPSANFPLESSPTICIAAPGKLAVFALRNGQLWQRSFVITSGWEDWLSIASPSLALIGYGFDEEWKWLGSYATWRAAMFVYINPENLLHPVLIKYKTPAFDKLLNATQSGTLAPAAAHALINNYNNYFLDVLCMTIHATCAAQMPDGGRVFLFGRAGSPGSGKLYWCSYDLERNTGYEQTRWQEIPFGDDKAPHVNDQRIIGALPCEIKESRQRFICLFYKTGTDKVYFTKLDIDHYTSDDAWDNAPVELTFGWPVHQISILPVQSDSFPESPQLAILATRKVYIRGVNVMGGWQGDANGKWDGYEIRVMYKIDSNTPELVESLEVALSVNNLIWLVFKNRNEGDGKNVLVRKVFCQGGSSFIISRNPGPLYGVLPLRIESSILLFYKEGDKNMYWRIGKTTSIPFRTLSDMVSLVVHSGDALTRPLFFIYRSNNVKDFNPYYAFRYLVAGDQLINSSKFRVSLSGGNAWYSIVQFSASTIQERRVKIKLAMEALKTAPASLMVYIKEAYYFVPLYIALKLQAAGYYVEALDWFCLIYDYRAPLQDRNIYYGLDIDAALPETNLYQLSNDWLLDPLNPHLIAATRRYAYTRYTLISLVKCLLDFADSEFSTDTSESLPRARVLYRTTEDLLNLPVLYQQLNACDDLFAELQITPGKDIPPEVPVVIGEIKEALTKGWAGNSTYIGDKIKEMATILSDTGIGWESKLSEVRKLAQKTIAQVPPPLSTAAILTTKAEMLQQKHTALLTRPEMDHYLSDVAKAAVNVLPSIF